MCVDVDMNSVGHTITSFGQFGSMLVKVGVCSCKKLPSGMGFGEKKSRDMCLTYNQYKFGLDLEFKQRNFGLNWHKY